MTDEEMRELDAWLAKHVFGVEVEYDSDGEPYNRKTKLQLPCDKIIGYIRRYTKDPKSFTAVKREIERRGWNWCASKCQTDIRILFLIWDEDMRRIGDIWAETEELAGCLALKAAVEAADGHERR